MMSKHKKYNRIRVILADKEKTIKWLAGQIGRKPNTVSRWCRNEIQPPVEMFYQIAEILKVDIYDLLNSVNKVDKEF